MKTWCIAVVSALVVAIIVLVLQKNDLVVERDAAVAHVATLEGSLVTCTNAQEGLALLLGQEKQRLVDFADSVTAAQAAAVGSALVWEQRAEESHLFAVRLAWELEPLLTGDAQRMFYALLEAGAHEYTALKEEIRTLGGKVF